MDWMTHPPNLPKSLRQDGDWVAISHRPSTSGQLSTRQAVDEILERLVEASETQTTIPESQLQQMYAGIKARLAFTLGTDIRGRTAADTAFGLALTGCTDEDLFQTLAHVARLELERGHQRKSRTMKDMLQVVEKLAAAGIRGPETDSANRLVAKVLNQRAAFSHVAQQLAMPGSFSLLSPRPLLWLWRFSSRLNKAETGLRLDVNAQPTVGLRNVPLTFQDPSRPLVIDLGCGLGVSLLGLASLNEGSASKMGIDWGDCNYLGCDLNPLLIRFGSAIAARWGLYKKLQYVDLSVEDLLDRVKIDYDGPIALVMIQFPTPFRATFANAGNGNQQLPSSTESGFMISEIVMRKIVDLLPPGGALLVQSNCEDVAVYLRDQAASMGLCAVLVDEPVLEPRDDLTHRLTRRTQEWIEHGGERAVGREWTAHSILPQQCSTETEIACLDQKTPVHRTLLTKT